jgi:exodeoxyribonuclease VII small subunit
MASRQSSDAAQNINSLSFEEAFRRLGEAVDSLETGGLTLAEATARYEEGMSLVRRCNQLLNEAELKVAQLKDIYTTPTGLPDWDEEEVLPSLFEGEEQEGLPFPKGS